MVKGIQIKGEKNKERERAIGTGQIKFQLGKLYSLCSSNINKMTESRILRLAEHLAHMREMRNASKFLLVNIKWKTIVMPLGVGGRLLKRVLEKWSLRTWTEFH